MKRKREGLEIKDFSGGLLTNAPLINSDLSHSPNCLNVYAEGVALRKREGTTTLNSTTVAGNPNGNGILNWVLNASQQYIMALFGNSLKQMSLSGSSWDGTFVTVSPHSADGIQLTDSIMHSVIYNGNLIMTTEARNKPQVLTKTASSYISVDSGGVGTAPQAKYLQVWKNHLWMLNLGGGGLLTEDCASISSWTDSDTGTGASTQETFQGNDTFRFRAGTNSGDDAKRLKDAGDFTGDITVELRTYFDTLSTVSSGDYASFDISNGVVKFEARFSDDGLEVNDGTTWNEIGVNTVSEDSWNVWKFHITAGTSTGARVDVYKNSSPIGLQFTCANAVTASDGQVTLFAKAGGTSTRADWYMDYVYINSVSSRLDYVTNGSFENFTGDSPDNWSVFPTQPLVHVKFNDNAATSVVVNDGVESTDGALYALNTTIDTSTIDSSGKITNTFDFNSASTHHIRLNSTTVTSMKNDLVGTFTFWLNADSTDGKEIMSASHATGPETRFSIRMKDTGGGLFLVEAVDSAQVTILNLVTAALIDVDSWSHWALVQNGTTMSIYKNASSVSFSGTTGGHWLATVGSGTMDQVSIGARRWSNTTDGGWDGQIDDFRYYSSALTSTEIAAIYAESNGTEGAPATTSEGTIIKHLTKSLEVNTTSSYMVVTQSLASGVELAGSASIIGAWVNATNLLTYKLVVNDGSSDFSSGVLTANGTWQYQTLSFTPASATTSVRVSLITTSPGTAYFDQVSVVLDSSAAANDLADRLQRTAIGTYNDFSGTDSGNNDITTPGDAGLTGSGILNDKLYVFKKWSIHRITYTASTPLLDIKQAKATVGTASPRSIKNIDIPGRGEVLIFLGTDRRIYIFDGYETIPISDHVSVNNGLSSVYMKNINAQALDKVFAVVHSNLSWYEIFVPISSTTVPDYSIVIDLSRPSSIETIAFWPNDNRNFLSGDVSDNGAGQRVVYVQGNTNGQASLLISSNSDAGTAINSYWHSFKLGSSVILGKMDEIEVVTDSVASSTPTFGWRMDWESSYTTKTLSASSYSHNFNPNRIDNLAQFEIIDNSSNPSFKLWSIGLYERVIGLGK